MVRFKAAVDGHVSVNRLVVRFQAALHSQVSVSSQRSVSGQRQRLTFGFQTKVGCQMLISDAWPWQ